MKIREASRTEVDVVVDLITAMLREITSYSKQGLSREDRVRLQLRGRFTEGYEKQGYAYLVAAVGDPEELAGSVEISAVSLDGVFPPGMFLHIHSLYVRPYYRRQGIGRRLLEKALEWGREQGCVEAGLSVLAQNPVRELYERMGFEISELEMRLEL